MAAIATHAGLGPCLDGQATTGHGRALFTLSTPPNATRCLICTAWFVFPSTFYCLPAVPAAALGGAAPQSPEEVDTPAAIADGSVPGVKAAALRKLHHELGIAPGQLPATGFRYLTRLHYCAADTDTWGPNAEWGEHEMDYVLFIRCGVV